MENNQKTGKLLEVKDLHVSFFTPAGEVKAVGGISYDLNYDEVMGIVGESGSGKSVEAYSIIGLLQSPGKVIGGSITLEGEDMLAKTKDNVKVLHPLPRVNEIATDVDDSDKAYYFQQAKNGLYARQAIICDVLGITLDEVRNDK